MPELLPVGKELLIRVTVCSVCITTSIYYFLVVFHFVFAGGTVVMIASVPGHCLPFIFTFSYAVWNYSSI